MSKRVLVCLLLSVGCSSGNKRNPDVRENVVDLSVFDFQTGLVEAGARVALWVSGSDVVSEEFLGRLIDGVVFVPAGGQPQAATLVSADFSQSLLVDAVRPQPAEMVFDVSGMGSGSWARLEASFPEPMQWRGLPRQSRAVIHFWAGVHPVVSSIVFYSSGLDVRFSQRVEGDVSKAFVVDDGRVHLPCTPAWGSNQTFVYLSCGSLPSTVRVELTDGVLSSGGEPLRAVSGEPFAVSVSPAELPLTVDDNRLWVPSL